MADAGLLHQVEWVSDFVISGSYQNTIKLTAVVFHAIVSHTCALSSGSSVTNGWLPKIVTFVIVVVPSMAGKGSLRRSQYDTNGVQSRHKCGRPTNPAHPVHLPERQQLSGQCTASRDQA